MKLPDERYRCDVCHQSSEARYVRGWVLDDDGREREVEPQQAEQKHVCVVCEARGVFMLGMPALVKASGLPDPSQPDPWQKPIDRRPRRRQPAR